MSNQSNTPPPSPVLPEKDWVEIPLVQARRIVVRFLRKLFAASPNPALRWIPDDPKASTITILESFPENLDRYTNRPVIAVETSGLRAMGLTIDTMEYESLNGDTKIYSDLMSTTLLISCVSPSAIESEHLAWLVAKYSWLLKNWLRKNGFFEAGRGIQTSPVIPISQMVQDAVSTYRVTTVSLPMYFQQRHVVSPSLRNWNKFDATISSVSTIPQNNVPYPKNIEDGSITYQSPDGTKKRRATENWKDAPPEVKQEQPKQARQIIVEGDSDG